MNMKGILTMATLYEMTTQANELYELLQNDEIDEQVFLDTLEAIGTEEKIESYCQVIKELKGDLEKFKTESDRLTARMKTAKNSIDRMNDSLLSFLRASGQSKVKAGTFTVSIGTSKATNILDESLIPTEFKTPQPDKIDKTAIKKAIESGSAVAGAEIIINESVRIR
jgi:hypothetical protein